MPRFGLQGRALSALAICLLGASVASGYAHEVHKDFFDLAFKGRASNGRACLV